jgi:hypothetical protein
VLDVFHDSILSLLRDAKRVIPKHGVHLPPIVASPLEDPLPKPWESFVSNKTCCHACFEALYQCPLPLAHLPGAFIGFMEVCLVVVDPLLHTFLVSTWHYTKIFLFSYTKIQKKMKYSKTFAYLCICRRNLAVMACPDLLWSQSMHKGSPPKPSPVDSTKRKTPLCRLLAPYHLSIASSPRSTMSWLDHKLHAEQSQL